MRDPAAQTAFGRAAAADRYFSDARHIVRRAPVDTASCKERQEALHYAKNPGTDTRPVFTNVIPRVRLSQPPAASHQNKETGEQK